MKKLLVCLFFLIGCIPPTITIGAELTDFSYYYVQTDGFLNQEDNGSDFDYVCGPMAVIIGQNYYEQKYTQMANRTYSILHADLVEAYNEMGKSFNSMTNIHYNLTSLLTARGFNSERHYGYNETTTDINSAYSTIKDEIADDKVIICFLEAGSTLLPLDIQNSGINHAIVVYATYSSGGTDYYVRYVDPWDGRRKQVSVSAFKNALYLGDSNDFLSFSD